MMKAFTLAAVLFSSAAFAYPQAGYYQNDTNTNPGNPTPPTYPPGAICTPGTYQCRSNGDQTWGWDVCDVNHRWVNGGNCAPSDTCVFNTMNGSPYCVPTGSSYTPGGGSYTPGGGSGGDRCLPGKSRCNRDSGRWTVERCTAERTWDAENRCNAGETCTYAIDSGDAYCVPNNNARVCKPGTYQCAFSSSQGGWGWEVCTVAGQWVWGGNCRSGETCSFNPLNGSPYCI